MKGWSQRNQSGLEYTSAVDESGTGSSAYVIEFAARGRYCVGACTPIETSSALILRAFGGVGRGDDNVVGAVVVVVGSAAIVLAVFAEAVEPIALFGWLIDQWAVGEGIVRDLGAIDGCECGEVLGILAVLNAISLKCNRQVDKR